MSEFNQHNAISIGFVTLVGTPNTGNEPSDRGNCFSVELDDKRSVKIVNFNYENLKKLQKLGLKWPIKVSLLTDGIGLIADQRIHPRWVGDIVFKILPNGERLVTEKMSPDWLAQHCTTTNCWMRCDLDCNELHCDS